MRFFFTRYGTSVVPLAVALMLLGCSSEPRRYAVSGTVKYKGQPIKTGSISFLAENGSSGGAPISDGKYEIPSKVGLTPGSYKVAINYPDPKAPLPDPQEPPGETAVARDLLPAKYNSETTLTAEIKDESNEINFELK